MGKSCRAEVTQTSHGSYLSTPQPLRLWSRNRNLAMHHSCMHLHRESHSWESSVLHAVKLVYSSLNSLSFVLAFTKAELARIFASPCGSSAAFRISLPFQLQQRTEVLVEFLEQFLDSLLRPQPFVPESCLCFKTSLLTVYNG